MTTPRQSRRFVLEFTPEEADVIAARANSSHMTAEAWLQRIARQRITAPRTLTERQAAVREAWSRGLDDVAIANELKIPKAYAQDARRRLNLRANPKRKASA